MNFLAHPCIFKIIVYIFATNLLQYFLTLKLIMNLSLFLFNTNNSDSLQHKYKVKEIKTTQLKKK